MRGGVQTRGWMWRVGGGVIESGVGLAQKEEDPIYKSDAVMVEKLEKPCWATFHNSLRGLYRESFPNAPIVAAGRCTHFTPPPLTHT